jgi:hypothetical protein
LSQSSTNIIINGFSIVLGLNIWFNYLNRSAWFNNKWLKFKFILDRKTLETIYITFIRPLLEYADVFWDTKTQILMNKPESCSPRCLCSVTVLMIVLFIIRLGWWGLFNFRAIVMLSVYLCNQCLSLLTLWIRTQLRRDVLDATLRDKCCQWLAAGRWYSGFLHIIRLGWWGLFNFREIVMVSVFCGLIFTSHFVDHAYNFTRSSLSVCAVSCGSSTISTD